MKFITCILFVSLLLFSANVAGQERIDYEAIYKIKQEGLQNSQVMDIAFHLTDVTGPRLTGSPGLRKASEWARDQLTEWGLVNANLEKWGEFGKGWEVNKMYVAMTAPYYQPLIGMAKAWTPGTNGLLKSQVVLVEAETEEEIEAYAGKLEGKIVLFGSDLEFEASFDPDAVRFTEEELENQARQPLESRPAFTPERIRQFRTRRTLSNKLRQFVKDQGAVAIITGRRGKHGTFFTSNGASYSPDAPEILPEIEMAPEHAARMMRLLNANIEVEVEMDIQTTFFNDDLNGYNVVAEIPGTDKNLKSELVMLGGHLDSWHAGTGATDNAAGCAVMMEAVRILIAADLKPRRTIRIALWTGEEQGIHGSRNYVKNHFADPDDMKLKPEHKRLSAYYNIDNGTGRIRGIYLQGNEAVRPIFEAWFEPFNDMIENTTITIRNTGGTDHLGFDAVGLPGFQFIQDPIEYRSLTHHTNMDTYERLQEADLKQMAVIVASFVYHTAMRNDKLPREPITN